MRTTWILLAMVAATLAGAALPACEDDGGAPGWNDFDDGGHLTAADAASVRDAAMGGDAATSDGAVSDAGGN